MKFQTLRLQDRAILEPFFGRDEQSLCGYAFENIVLWRPLFDVVWKRINGHVCIFFVNAGGIFMPLPPLGPGDKKTVVECFRIMEETNHNPDLSRIENISQESAPFFKEMGLKLYEKNKEYIVAQGDVAGLAGAKFKHKRNLYHHFSKNHKALFRDFFDGDRSAVLTLYQEWMEERLCRCADPVYCALLADSFKVFRAMLESFRVLTSEAKVVECDGKIRAFTSGFAVNKNLFCINFEIADLSLKGLSTFVFCEFARALKRYPEINIMDDSGIKNLRRTKEIWHPRRTVASYTALMKP